MLVFDISSGQQLCSQKVNEEDTYSTATFFADSRKLAFGGLKGIFYVMVCFLFGTVFWFCFIVHTCLQ